MSDERPRRTIRIEIAPRTLVWVLVGIAAVWLAFELWAAIVVLLVALVLVGTFDPFVAWLERRGLRRSRALALIFVVVGAGVAAILLVTVPPLLSQLSRIIGDAPVERRKIADFLSQYNWTAPLARSLREVPLDKVVADAEASLLGYGGQILSAIGYAITTLFLAIYLLADPSRAKAVVYALVPRAHHVKLSRILIELKTIVGGYMRGQVITSVAITVFTFALLSAFHVREALALAIFAGLTDVIPFVGGYLASVPAILSVSSRGTAAIVIVAIAMFVYQEFESRILVPRLYGRVLRLSPALVLLALLAGGMLEGILGALLALPIAAGLQMLVRELGVELPGEPPGGDAEAARERDAEAAHDYEQRVTGAPVAKAPEIADQVAKEHDPSIDKG
ncbi:MAG TPA: AI-2E family transporter [Kofleriaceae bacterium]|nr:AI-2E family transporter [Kofleriaceae bacterium]